jgi:cell division septal protein FtsQ
VQDSLPNAIAEAKRILEESKQRYEQIRSSMCARSTTHATQVIPIVFGGALLVFVISDAQASQQRGLSKIKELERGTQFYQQYLGLEFRRTEG